MKQSEWGGGLAGSNKFPECEEVVGGAHHGSLQVLHYLAAREDVATEPAPIHPPHHRSPPHVNIPDSEEEEEDYSTIIR